jgi:adenine-specific DNA-methyltransferase
MTKVMVRRNGRKHGEVFTDKNIVQYILDEVGYTSSKDLRDVKILEPASGKGAFAKEIIERLFQSSNQFHFSFYQALVKNVRFIELDLVGYKELIEVVQNEIEEFTKQKREFASKICFQTDFLTYSFKTKFDCIVGNPPYIRHELISEQNKKLFRKKYTSFKYRADLYVLFFEQSLNLLKNNGLLSFICSNRWLNNQYGEGLRELISSRYNLMKVLNIEKSSPFDEDVIAYPCITTICKNSNSGKTLFFEYVSKEISFRNIIFEEVETPKNSSWQNLFLRYNINHTALTGIIEQGFKVGIGVATGADGVFIKAKSELNGIEKSRLIPLIKSRDLKNDKFKWGEHYVINPYENNTLCNLDNYPHLKNYLTAHKARLIKRHTAQKAPTQWYKTIDKIKPEIQHKPKLLLPDLSNNKFLFIDNGEFYPHHNIYYITCTDIIALKILASILMSEFVREQISQIGIRMNGGLPRFQSQVLKKIKVPNIGLMSVTDKTILIHSYENKNLDAINRVVKKYCLEQGISKAMNKI